MALRLIGKPSPLLPSLPSPLLHRHVHPLHLPLPLPLPLITSSLPQQVLFVFSVSDFEKEICSTDSCFISVVN